MKKLLLLSLASVLTLCSLCTFASNSNSGKQDGTQQTTLTGITTIESDGCTPKNDVGFLRDNEPAVAVSVRVYSLDADKDTSNLNFQKMYDKSKSNDMVFRNKLSNYGRVQLFTTTNLVTLDQHPAPFSASTESGNLVEYKPTLSQVKQTSFVDTSTFGGVFTPTILEDNNLELTTCLNYTVVKHSMFDNVILPNTSSSQQVNHTRLKSGETNVSTWFQLNSEKSNQIIVLTTPTIL